MVEIRPAAFEQDCDAIAALDTSFETDTIFELQRVGRGFQLTERSIAPPIAKVFRLRLATSARDRSGRTPGSRLTAEWGSGSWQPSTRPGTAA
jgi:hypothetical protein